MRPLRSASPCALIVVVPPAVLSATPSRPASATGVSLAAKRPKSSSSGATDRSAALSAAVNVITSVFVSPA
jgi:hypothetical protein